MWTLIGLGNPGSRYDDTRHNIGFELIDLLSERWDIPVRSRSQVMVFGSGVACDEDVLLIKPSTYMNRSGAVIPTLRRQPEFDLSRCLVIFDEMQLPVGTLRIRSKGSAGGHNGLKHILEVAKSQDVPRMRIGVDAPSRPDDWADYVLSPFRDEEREVVDIVLHHAADATEMVLKQGVIPAMNQYNSLSI